MTRMVISFHCYWWSLEFKNTRCYDEEGKFKNWWKCLSDERGATSQETAILRTLNLTFKSSALKSYYSWKYRVETLYEVSKYLWNVGNPLQDNQVLLQPEDRYHARDLENLQVNFSRQFFRAKFCTRVFLLFQSSHPREFYHPIHKKYHHRQFYIWNRPSSPRPVCRFVIDLELLSATPSTAGRGWIVFLRSVIQQIEILFQEFIRTMNLMVRLIRCSWQTLIFFSPAPSRRASVLSITKGISSAQKLTDW